MAAGGMDESAVTAILDRHRAAGHEFSAAGITGFTLDQGSGDPVVLIHGLPVSSFLYRRVVPALAQRGLRAMALDLPGLGLTDRPEDFDYSLAGLGRFVAAAVDALDLERFHLVVHDAGGPVGFELAGAMRDRIRSLTILNTMVSIGSTPYPGEVVARVSGRFPDALATPGLFRRMMWRVGIEDTAAVPVEEIEVHRRLLLDADGGAGYLRIMRTVRDTDSSGWAAVVDSRSVPYPVAVAWGGKDPLLSLRRHGWATLAATGLRSMTVLPAKHYLQEDCPDEVAAVIAANAHRAGSPATPEESS